MSKKPDMRHKQIGGRHRAASRYAMLVYRVTHTDTDRNKNYRDIEVRVDKQEFIAWFMARDFEGCSVDRIDKAGHYELANMQVISLQYNIAKDKLKAKNGRCVCYKCKQEKNLAEFTRDNRRMHTGRATICKACESTRPKNQSEEARLRAIVGMKAYYRRRKSARSTGK